MFFFFMSFFFSFLGVSVYLSFLFVVKGEKALGALKSAVISYQTPLSVPDTNASTLAQG